jgi:hypothetical protein
MNLLQNAKIDSSVVRVTEHLKNFVGQTSAAGDQKGAVLLQEALKDVEMKLSALKNSRKSQPL